MLNWQVSVAAAPQLCMQFTMNDFNLASVQQQKMMCDVYLLFAHCRGIYYGFASEPTFDIAARPLGVSISNELPGLVTAVRQLLGRLIMRRMVEPDKRFFDVQRMYHNRHVHRVRLMLWCTMCVIGDFSTRQLSGELGMLAGVQV